MHPGHMGINFQDEPHLDSSADAQSLQEAKAVTGEDARAGGLVDEKRLRVLQQPENEDCLILAGSADLPKSLVEFFRACGVEPTLTAKKETGRLARVAGQEYTDPIGYAGPIGCSVLAGYGRLRASLPCTSQGF